MNQTTPHRLLVEYLNALVEQLDIPTFATRIALNFRVSSYYQDRSGFHPVEIQLNRATNQSGNTRWSIVFITSFAYPDEQTKKLEVELYFNFLRGWFYQPEIERCELHLPQVTSLYESYERSFLKQIQQGSFDGVQATLVNIDTPTESSIASPLS
ncbi:DUF2787 domain-containing protein [Vibrio cyclitrophicus]|uniref:DUF2787 domain-containing protein n=1 Tax=Vibrio cyclitrophicus TaxID=47951 RepID=UPI00148D0100|nr:DUF2787 domain-containing protein [Vibrio cyclitrophicus]NOH43425.1 DUF2787 domain-containing protein [Vibrio cyclitrophicus]